MFTIERYKLSHFWAVYEKGELVCVTVYKKGAVAVRNRLLALATNRRRLVKSERALRAQSPLPPI